MTKECQIKKIGDYLFTGKTLGKGHFGRVELVVHTITNVQVAAKVSMLSNTDKQRNVERSYLREISILSKLNHPNIVKIYEKLRTKEICCIIMEYLEGGSLLRHVNTKPERRFVENDAKVYFNQIVSVLDYLHKRRIVHRDLKMENILLQGATNQTIKVIDFGLSNTFAKDQYLTTKCGSWEYAAPELFKKHCKYRTEVDIWSLGVVLYRMLVGELPFVNQKTESTCMAVKGLTVSHHMKMKHLSSGCVVLLSNLLQTIPSRRYTIQNIISHSWGEYNMTCNKISSSKLITVDPRIKQRVVSATADLLGVSKTRVLKSIELQKCDSTYALYNILLVQEEAKQTTVSCRQIVPIAVHSGPYSGVRARSAKRSVHDLQKHAKCVHGRPIIKKTMLRCGTFKRIDQETENHKNHNNEEENDSNDQEDDDSIGGVCGKKLKYYISKSWSQSANATQETKTILKDYLKQTRKPQHKHRNEECEDIQDTMDIDNEMRVEDLENEQCANDIKHEVSGDSFCVECARASKRSSHREDTGRSKGVEWITNDNTSTSLGSTEENPMGTQENHIGTQGDHVNTQGDQVGTKGDQVGTQGDQVGTHRDQVIRSAQQGQNSIQPDVKFETIVDSVDTYDHESTPVQETPRDTPNNDTCPAEEDDMRITGKAMIPWGYTDIWEDKHVDHTKHDDQCTVDDMKEKTFLTEDPQAEAVHYTERIRGTNEDVYEHQRNARLKCVTLQVMEVKEKPSVIISNRPKSYRFPKKYAGSQVNTIPSKNTVHVTKDQQQVIEKRLKACLKNSAASIRQRPHTAIPKLSGQAINHDHRKSSYNRPKTAIPTPRNMDTELPATDVDLAYKDPHSLEIFGKGLGGLKPKTAWTTRETSQRVAPARPKTAAKNLGCMIVGTRCMETMAWIQNSQRHKTPVVTTPTTTNDCHTQQTVTTWLKEVTPSYKTDKPTTRSAPPRNRATTPKEHGGRGTKSAGKPQRKPVKSGAEILEKFQKYKSFKNAMECDVDDHTTTRRDTCSIYIQERKFNFRSFMDSENVYQKVDFVKEARQHQQQQQKRQILLNEAIKTMRNDMVDDGGPQDKTSCQTNEAPCGNMVDYEPSFLAPPSILAPHPSINIVDVDDL